MYYFNAYRSATLPHLSTHKYTELPINQLVTHQLYSSLILTLFKLNQEVKEMSVLRGIETLNETNFHLTNNNNL